MEDPRGSRIFHFVEETIPVASRGGMTPREQEQIPKESALI
jgi:hypothetical protein